MNSKQQEKVPRWAWRIAWLLLIVGILVVASTTTYKSLPSWGSGLSTKTITQEKPSFQDPCSERYISASIRRIPVTLPANGSLSEEITFTAPAGKCYWFEGPQGTEVWFNDGTHGPITKQYPPKIPKLRFSNPSGGTLNIAIER